MEFEHALQVKDGPVPLSANADCMPLSLSPFFQPLPLFLFLALPLLLSLSVVLPLVEVRVNGQFLIGLFTTRSL